MSTTQQHGNIPGTAVEFAPGLWRTSLQRYDLSVPGHKMIQSRPGRRKTGHISLPVATSCPFGQEGSRHD